MGAAAKPNTHEIAARAAKVERLVKVLDVHLVAAGINPYTAQACTFIEQLSEKGWHAATVVACINPPSFETRDAVIAVYRARPEHVAAVRRATGV